MNIEKLLTRDQKEGIIRHMIREVDHRLVFTLRYNRRFGWDFEVRRHGLRPIVTFSVGITDERLGFVAQECARAIREIQQSTYALEKTQQSSIPIAIMGLRRIVDA